MCGPNFNSQAGSQDLNLNSHIELKGILTVKQRGAVERVARATPLAIGTQVHASLQNFSPGLRVPFDQRSRKTVDRLVRRTRQKVMAERVGGIALNCSEGKLNELAESLSLVKFLERHNDPADPFHMDEHQPVCVGHQFQDGVTFMSLTTPHFLNNLARAEKIGCQKQGHFDGALNWCGKDFGMIGFGMNSMGAHFNPVSLSIVNSESKEAIKSAYTATCSGVYTLCNQTCLCDDNIDKSCGFCTQLFEQISEPGSLWKKQLASDEAANMKYMSLHSRPVIALPNSFQLPRSCLVRKWR
jgi:hypothetical protein